MLDHAFKSQEKGLADIYKEQGAIYEQRKARFAKRDPESVQSVFRVGSERARSATD